MGGRVCGEMQMRPGAPHVVGGVGGGRQGLRGDVANAAWRSKISFWFPFATNQKEHPQKRRTRPVDIAQKPQRTRELRPAVSMTLHHGVVTPSFAQEPAVLSITDPPARQRSCQISFRIALPNQQTHHVPSPVSPPLGLHEKIPTVDGRNPFRTTLKPCETIVCWYLHGSHPFQDFRSGA